MLNGALNKIFYFSLLVNCLSLSVILTGLNLTLRSSVILCVCVCVCIVCVNDAGNATLFELLFECKTQLSNVIYQQKIFVTRPAVTLCIVIARQTLNYSKSV